MISSYQKIHRVGKPEMASLRHGDVIIEEKIDGSQFSAMLVEGKVHFKSKRQEVKLGDSKMFDGAIISLNNRAHLMKEGLVYRGEVLAKPKHNVLTYDRVPEGNFILWDAGTGPDKLSRFDLGLEANKLSLEVVPVLYRGAFPTDEKFKELLEIESKLGGMIEGLVVKPAERSSSVAIAKYVAASFAEVHESPKMRIKDDPIQTVVDMFATPARWEKALQSLRESGEFTGTEKDIGKLMKAASLDLIEEEAGAIADALYAVFRKQVVKKSIAGLPAWFLDKLQSGGLE